MSNVDPRSLARLISEDIRTNNGFLFEAGENKDPEGIKQLLTNKEPPPTKEFSKDMSRKDRESAFGSREAVVHAKAAYEQAERSYKDYERSKDRLRGATSGPAVWQHMNRLKRIFNLLASVKAGLYDPLYAYWRTTRSPWHGKYDIILNYLKQGETDEPETSRLGFNLSDVEDFVRGMIIYLGQAISTHRASRYEAEYVDAIGGGHTTFSTRSAGTSREQS